ncbi:MAG: hemin uptake protein HemP [Oceanospirillaceae bacterium]|nr:hemin uptake protein HemP [Oceanospirillaceae bacterium]
MSITTSEPKVAEKSIKTEQLMQGNNKLVIMHCDQRYILRITRNGKLILTK